MAKIGQKGDPKLLYKVLGGMVLVSALSTAYIFWSSPSTPQQQAQASQKSSSLGAATEAGAAYNRTFQELLQKSVSVKMDEMRTEQDSRLSQFEKNLRARDAEQEARLQEKFDSVVQAQKTQQDAQQPSRNVEKIEFHTTGSPKDRQGEVGGFLGSPADVKPLTAELAEVAPADSKKDVAGLNVPPNGFIKGKTLNGIVAVVDAPAKGFLVKLKGKYRAANGFVVDLNACTAYVEGRADLSAGRILGKPATLTCIFVDGTTKNWPVSGYIVDEDGIEGIVGIINDNSGKKMAGATIASGIAITGNALSRAQTSSYTSSAGTSQAVTGSVGADIAGGLIQGGGAELSRQVQEHYNQYKASVQVAGNRDITVVLLNELAVPDAGKAITVTHGAGTTKGSQ